MTGLRTYEGVDLQRLRARWGVELLDQNRALIARLESEGLASLESDRLVPSLDGLAVAESLASSFRLLSPREG